MSSGWTLSGHLALMLLGLLCMGVTGGGCGKAGQASVDAVALPAATARVLDPTEDLPGVVFEITSVGKPGGGRGNLAVGDRVAVTYFLTQRDGSPLPLADLDSAAILASGPTFNYQPVLARRSDLQSESVANADGSYTYTFAERIPAEYLPPANDTPAFGASDGELQGQALLDGTYTVGIEGYRDYTVLAKTYRDPGGATKEFLVGSSAVFAIRDVVSDANCDQCHARLAAHGGSRVGVRACVLCHTSGAEDKNVPTAAGGTPGVSVDFRVLIHKLHNGKHLPSVLGVTTDRAGARVYDATPAPYQVVGDSVRDFSRVGFPIYPNANSPMPRDTGYGARSATEQAQDDSIRRGVTACAKCHGDPDGPAGPPAQGDLAYGQPNRRACGACHDDVAWGADYVENGQTMPAQPTDAKCRTCHLPTAADALAAAPVAGISSLLALAVEDAHRHPILDPAFNPGMTFTLTSVAEAGATANHDGTVDVGENIQITFTVKDDAGADVSAANIDGLSVGLVGPLHNRNLLLACSSLPPGALHAQAQPFVLNLPADVSLEYQGNATGGADVFTTALSQHWDSRGASTIVSEIAITGPCSTLTVAAVPVQNHIDVAAGTAIVGGDTVSIARGRGGFEEYLVVAKVDANVGGSANDRIWFDAPLRVSHARGEPVTKVTLSARTARIDYTLDEPTGTITLVEHRFTAGNAVVVDYTGDYRLPAVYPPAINDSPELGEAVGEWSGKAIVAGTYEVGVWGRQELTLLSGSVSQPVEVNDYAIPALAATRKVVLLNASPVPDPPPVISSPSNCNACHDDWISFHGGSRRGLDACLFCHGVAGAEDAGGPSPPAVSLNFRRLLHKLHMGRDLANAATYELGGHTYDAVGFPAQPGGAKQCDMCHGGGSWAAPLGKDHPTEQSPLEPARVWTEVCTSCHDSAPAAAHAAIQTGPGGEGCSVCHGTGAVEDVEVVHTPR